MHKEAARKLEHNMSSVVCQKNWIYILKILMEMFRECYADVLLLILTRIDGNRYMKAFGETAFFEYPEEKYNDSNKQLRMLLVAKTLSELGLEQDAWDQFYENQKNRLTVEMLDLDYCKKLDNGNVNLGFTSEMESIYKDYLLRCAHSFQKEYDGHPMMTEFKNYVKNLLNTDKEDILFHMLQLNTEYLGEEGETVCAQ